MDIVTPDTGEIDKIVDLWAELAESQRQYDAHILSEENRTGVRETLVHQLVAGQVIVARDGPNPADIHGFASFRIESGSFERAVSRGIIDNLYVVPKRRSEGIGSALLEAAESRLANHDVDRIALEVLAANEAGRRFYQRYGYEPHRLELEKPVE